jgi:hypothetical protein
VGAAGKKPEAWQVEQWKEAIRWFYRTAKSMQPVEPNPGKEIPAVAVSPEPAGSAAWRSAFLTASNNQQPTSNNQHPTSDIQHPTSNWLIFDFCAVVHYRRRE